MIVERWSEFATRVWLEFCRVVVVVGASHERMGAMDKGKKVETKERMGKERGTRKEAMKKKE